MNSTVIIRMGNYHTYRLFGIYIGIIIKINGTFLPQINHPCPSIVGWSVGPIVTLADSRLSTSALCIKKAAPGKTDAAFHICCYRIFRYTW
jgi:hypothetical protein